MRVGVQSESCGRESNNVALAVGDLRIITFCEVGPCHNQERRDKAK